MIYDRLGDRRSRTLPMEGFDEMFTRRHHSMVVVTCLLTLVLASASSHTARAEEAHDYGELDLMELLSVVVTPTKRVQKPSEAPAVIAVITCRDLREHGYTSVAEALRAVPGVAVIDDHTYQHIGVRGIFGEFDTPNDIIRVMINGQPVSFRPLKANLLGPELIPIEAVKRIEVLRGPGSALYGAQAFLGVVNIITFDGSEDWGGAPAGDDGARHSVTAEGSFTSTEHADGPGGAVSAQSGGRWGAFRYFLAGSYRREDRSGLVAPGLPDVDARGWPSPGWSPEMRQRLIASSPSRDDIAQSASVYGQASWSLGDDASLGRLAVDGSLQYFDRHGEFLEFSYLTHANRLTYINGYTRLRYLLEPKNSGLALLASVAVSGGRPTDDHLVDPLAPSSYARREFGYTAFDGVVEAAWLFTPKDLVTIGFDISVDREDLLTIAVTSTESEATYREPGFGMKTFTTIGAYAQGMWTPVKGLTFTVGSRLDFDDAIGCSPDDWACLGRDGSHGLVRLSNRAGVTWLTGVAGLYAKAMYGSSYRPPSPYQLYHHQATIIGSEGNPNLLPETADTFEFEVGARPVEGLLFSLGGYATQVHGMVLSYLEGSTVNNRNADVWVSGLEGTVSWSPGDRLSLFANGNFIINSVLRPNRLPDETDIMWRTSLFHSEVPVAMFPRWMANGGITVRAPEAHLRVSLLLNYVGSRRASLVNNLLFNSTSLKKTYSLGGYLLGSLTVSSVGLRWLGMETVVSMSLKYAPGRQTDPGKGGLDIPGSGPRLFFRVEQRF